MTQPILSLRLLARAPKLGATLLVPLAVNGPGAKIGISTVRYGGELWTRCDVSGNPPWFIQGDRGTCEAVLLYSHYSERGVFVATP